MGLHRIETVTEGLQRIETVFGGLQLTVAVTLGSDATPGLDAAPGLDVGLQHLGGLLEVLSCSCAGP